jgi:Na+-translocating ferredoxin:NAD+ oxidoreductase subunit B
MSQLVDHIDALLPQTQCGKCGYAGCAPYAAAIAAGKAQINRCPPGGEAAIRSLAALLRRPVLALDERCGTARARQVAFIEEARCIGCTLCIQACPVDAILGAPKQMHTVLAELCTGCDLCVPPCPVDCIAMQPASGALAGWDGLRAEAARRRYQARTARLARERREPGQALARNAADGHADPDKRAAIDSAIARARARRAAAKIGTRPGEHRGGRS